ncbi:MAG: signal peptidase I [Planctomycetota bacterium]
MPPTKKTKKQIREEKRAAEKAKHAGKPLAVRAWHYWKPVILVLAILLPSRSIIVDWNDVPTGSMIPTIEIGDRILVNKLSYGVRVPFTMIWLSQWGEIERGEVVTLKSPTDGVRLVKRVMAVPGDTIQLIDNVVYVNGEPLEREPTGENILYTDTENRRHQMLQFIESVGEHDHTIILRASPGTSDQHHRARNYGPVQVPEDHYFMMGDNRDNSSDSRFFNTSPRRPSEGEYVPFVHRDLIFGRSRRVLLTFKLSNFANRFWKPIP